MDNEPEIKPPRERPKGITFLLAGIGLFLLDGGAHSLLLLKAGPLGWMPIVGGVALFILAVLWGTGRVRTDGGSSCTKPL